MTKQIPFRFGGKGFVLCSRNKKNSKHLLFAVSVTVIGKCIFLEKITF